MPGTKNSVRRTWLFAFLLLVSIPALWAQTTLTILHTNNINGTLENCLCADHPLGSIEKIKPQVDSIRSGSPNVLFMDAGDFFSAFGNTQKDRVSAEALRLLSYDLLSLGDQEFSNGAAFFRNEIYRADLPYIALNLKIKGIDRLARFKKINMDGLSVLITSVVNPEVFRFYDKAAVADIQVTDPFEALRSFLPRHSADFFILLSHMGLDLDKRIAGEFPSINLIVGGHSQDALKEALRVHQTYIVQAGSDGYYLGKTEVHFSKKKKITALSSRLLPMFIHLENDTKLAALARRYDFGFIENSFKHHKLPRPLSASYLVRPATSCAQCHPKQFDKWQKGPHARAWESIREKKKTKSAQCVACHVSGFGRPDGFINENLTPGLQGVTCSECHRTEPAHLQKKTRETVRETNASVCRRCHDTQNDPEFRFHKAKERVLHQNIH